ncbi:MAG: type II toxin-antitoxin system HicB family antitoxin, partial [Anaerolineae bacterium]
MRRWWDEEAGGYVVSCPALAGCYSEGDTLDEALENLKEAIVLCLEDLTSKVACGASVVLDTINRNQWQAQGIE